MAVGVFFAEGYEEIEALTVVDLLRRAEIETKMVSVTGNRQVTGSHQIPVQMDALLEEVDFSEIQMIVLPGGMPGTLVLEACAPLMEQVKAFHQEGKMIAAICAAPTIFGHLGLLEGEPACCYPGMEGDLTGAVVTDGPVARGRNIITSRGMGTAIDFGLAIIESIQGPEAARSMAEKIVYSGWKE
ncbi:MAG: DJ-1/PfpI family protein [Lachnospiraceae bacterium]|nr:DJ-1/PfpI family protein [Lachnospiraceae bacterium]